MKYCVLGAGMMGSAAAYDLATADPANEVLLCDVDLATAQNVARSIGPNVRPLQLDVRNSADLLAALDGVSVVISAVSYAVNYPVSRIAIEAGVHMCDMGGNNDVVDHQITLDADARRRAVLIVPNCGLAPGLINTLAMHGYSRFDTVDSIALRVGGLPQHPRPPLNYAIVFSVEGLINEYLEPATVIRKGVLHTVESLDDLEGLEFPAPFGRLEAFNTSGGLSLLPRLLQGKVRNLDYKTIRYPGHCEKFRTLVELGFASSEPVMVGGTLRTAREIFTELLRKKLGYADKDVVLARASITGHRQGHQETLVYELIDYYDETTRMTAMMRTTAFPTAITARMIATGVIAARGVLTPEQCVPGDTMIEELARRRITITEHFTAPEH
jgi:lysine 6-dehydrogenase